MLLARALTRDADDDREHLWAILLNVQNHYLMHTVVSVGTQSAPLVHPREVLGPALRGGRRVGNHHFTTIRLAIPPSREDLRLTRQLVEAAKLLDLNVHDYLIIGNRNRALGLSPSVNNSDDWTDRET